MRFRPRPSLLVAFALGAAAPAVGSAQEELLEVEPTVIASSLNGLTEAAVRARLSEPALARTEGAGAFWTYRLPTCALFVYFADEGRGLRATGAAAGPRRHGDPTPEAASCLASAERSADDAPPVPPEPRRAQP